MIFTFGDGFATGHIWPEWPQILQALLPDQQVINTAGIGAGPEFLVSRLIDQLLSMHGQTAIVQWPVSNRFDKLLQDTSWDKTINCDSKYSFNRVADLHDRTWWLSSGSDQVTEYHKHWVQSKQHQLRLDIYKVLVQNTLENIDCKYHFTCTQDQDTFSNQPRFKISRQAQIQPSPIIHFHWLLETVLPVLDLPVDGDRVIWLQNEINKIQWIAYDSERETHWSNIINAK